MLPLPSALPAPQLYTYFTFLLETVLFAADFVAADLAAFGALFLAAGLAAFFLVAIVVVISSYAP